MIDNEILHFSFRLEPHYTNSAPQIEILNNGIQILPITSINTHQDINVSVEVESNLQNCVLEIRRSNHDEVTPQTLLLQTVEVDGIDLKKILDRTKFYPRYPSQWLSEQQSQGVSWPEAHQGWLEWGWNGVWKLEYRTPFYDWLLKEL